MHRTAQRGRLKKFSLRVTARKWDGDFRFERHDSAGRIRAHLLGGFNRHPLQSDGVPLGRDPHDGRHTSGESRCHKIGWGKRFASSLIVHGGIGGQLGSGRAMNSLTVQLPLVTD